GNAFENVIELRYRFLALSTNFEAPGARPFTMPGRGAQDNQAMSREETKLRFKLWLLAIALSLALTWCVIDPAPGPVRFHKRDDHTPDADRRRAQAQAGGAAQRFGLRAALQPTAAPFTAAADEDLPEWPEYIELD